MVLQALPTPSRRVFVDSSAYLALRDRTDEHHAEAVAVLRLLAQARFRQFTSSAIIFEAHTLILSVLGITHGQAFLRDMEESNTAIIRVRMQDEERAKQIVARYSDKDFSLVDAASFALMERLHIPYAFTFDHHFQQYGFIHLNQEILGADA